MTGGHSQGGSMAVEAVIGNWLMKWVGFGDSCHQRTKLLVRSDDGGYACGEQSLHRDPTLIGLTSACAATFCRSGAATDMDLNFRTRSRNLI